jgi:hypothetical protein
MKRLIIISLVSMSGWTSISWASESRLLSELLANNQNTLCENRNTVMNTGKRYHSARVQLEQKWALLGSAGTAHANNIVSRKSGDHGQKMTRMNCNHHNALATGRLHPLVSLATYRRTVTYSGTFDVARNQSIVRRDQRTLPWKKYTYSGKTPYADDSTQYIPELDIKEALLMIYIVYPQYADTVSALIFIPGPELRFLVAHSLESWAMSDPGLSSRLPEEFIKIMSMLQRLLGDKSNAAEMPVHDWNHQMKRNMDDTNNILL